MTKADLIDQVSLLVEVTRKDSEVIVETIFDSIVRSLHAGRQDREFAASAASVPASASRAWAETPRPAIVLKCRPKTIPFFKPSKELEGLGQQQVTS